MTVEFIPHEQYSPEWWAARMGLPTASEFHTVMASGKGGGESITRGKYLRQLAGEILTEEPAPEGYTNGFMERGRELESEARALYSMMHGPVERVGFVRNGRKGASPDSLIGANGGLEIKTAIPAVHIDRLQRNRLPPEYVAQVQGTLWVTEREFWDFMSYCPKLPPLIVRVYRDEAKISEIAKAVEAFNEELDSLVASIRSYSDLRGALAA
jgi:hypothetical protein